MDELFQKNIVKNECVELHCVKEHKRVLELRQVVQTQTKLPSLVPGLKLKLFTEIDETDVKQVREDKAIIIREMLRNEYEIIKCQQMGKQYGEIVVKQECNQIKLKSLLANC